MQGPRADLWHSRWCRPVAAALWLFMLGGCALLPPDAGPSPDPSNPVQLNEAAVARAVAGDIETASLLLERAAVLAPHDARIAANLAALRDYRSAATRGRIVATSAPGASPPTPRRSDAASLAPPPPLWPPRP